MNQNIPALEEYATSFVWSGLDLSLRLTLFLAVMFFVANVLRNRSAATLHLVWKFAFVGVLILPLIWLMLPRWAIIPHSLFPHQTNAEDTTFQYSLTGDGRPEEDKLPFGNENESEQVVFDDEFPVLEGDHLPISTMAAPSTIESDEVEPSAISFTTWLALFGTAVWGIGCLGFLGRIWRGQLALKQLRKTSQVVIDSRTLEQADRARRRLHLDRPVEIVSQDRFCIPMTWGVWQPKVLLPKSAVDWSEERISLVFLHEMSHIKRWDCLWEWLVQICCAFYWFHPLVWRAAHCLRREREPSCDDLVLSMGVRRSTYAVELLDISTGGQRDVLQLCTAIAMAKSSEIRGRLQAILDDSTNRHQPTKVFTSLLAILLIVCSTTVAVVVRAAEQEEIPATTPQTSTTPRPVKPRANEEPEPTEFLRVPSVWSTELPRYDTVDISSNGKWMAAGSGFNREPGDLVVWDFKTQKERLAVRERFGIRAVKFSPDGKRLATASFDKTIKLYEVGTFRKLAQWRAHDVGVDAIAFSPDGTVLASGGRDNLIKLWNAATQNEIRTLKGHEDRVSYLQFASDGKTLLSSSEDKTARLWNVATGEAKHVLKDHVYSVEKAVFSPDGRVVATASWDGLVRLWNSGTGQIQGALIGHRQSVLALAFSPDGKQLLTGDLSGDLIQWDVTNRQLKQTVQAHASRLYSIAFDPTGKTFATASWDRTVKLWESDPFKESKVMPRVGKNGLPKMVMALAQSPDGNWMAAGHDDGTISLRNVKSGRVERELKGHQDAVTSLSFSTDGKSLASASLDKTVRLWSIAKGVHQKTLPHKNLVYAVAFSPNGRVLASGGYEKIVNLWNPITGQRLQSMKGHQGTIRSLAFSPDGNELASAGSDRVVRIWTAKNGELLHEMKGHSSSVRALAYSSDGKMLASGSEDHTIKIWNTADKRTESRTLKGHGNDVTCLAFSPQGTALASGSADSHVRIWDPSTGALRGELRAHIEEPRGLFFTRKSFALISSGLDGRFYVWKPKLTGRKSRRQPN